MGQDKAADSAAGKLLRNLYLLTGTITTVYSVLIAGSFAWNIRSEHLEQIGLAKKEALASLNKDLSFRSWATKHGGVYVPATAETPPNRYLNVPERDIVTPSGRQLTLMNPAYIMRQAIEEYNEIYGVKGHITSLNALNPENAPDPWERKALERFDRGDTEVAEIAELGGKPYLRLMQPMIVRKGCLKCHESQGYREGDIRGGLAVAVPLTPYLALEKESMRNQTVSHLLIWFLGVAGIGFGFFKGKAGIAGRMRTEEELQRERVLLRCIIDSANDLIFIKNRESAYLACNKASEKLIGLPESEQIGKTDFDFFDQETASRIRENDRQVIEEGKTVQTEEWLTYPDGGKALLDTMKVPFFGPDGEIHGLVGICRDITEHRSLENQLRQSQKMEAVGTLTGGIAHDFNNILTAIIGFGSLMEMKMAKDDPLRDNITQILAAAERAANLTRSMLAFSRKQTMEAKPTNLNEIVAGMEKMLRRLIRENIELRIRLADEALQVLADAGQVEQVLLNLTTNARDSMPAGGVITISTGKTELDDSFRRAHGYGEPGRYALIAFADNGKGMEESVRQRIFEPFFSTKEVGKGTGLGLSVCYGIIKQHNGYIVCYSEPGRGTTIRIYLPMCQSSEEDEAAAEVVHFGGGSETILLAEDDKAVRELTTRILNEYGYTVIKAENGEEAVARFIEKADEIQLCLLDVIMPKKNGREACEEIMRVRPGIKVLFMSGYQADISRQEGLLSVGADLIMKPVMPRELLKRVREILDRSSS